MDYRKVYVRSEGTECRLCERAQPRAFAYTVYVLTYLKSAAKDAMLTINAFSLCVKTL